jgi:hypothetical protein
LATGQDRFQQKWRWCKELKYQHDEANIFDAATYFGREDRLGEHFGREFAYIPGGSISRQERK